MCMLCSVEILVETSHSAVNAVCCSFPVVIRNSMTLLIFAPWRSLRFHPYPANQSQQIQQRRRVEVAGGTAREPSQERESIGTGESAEVADHVHRTTDSTGALATDIHAERPTRADGQLYTR